MSEIKKQHVIDYLQQHPDFLIQHPALLAQLELQQQTQGAVSLVHIQQRQLREHNTQLKNKIESMNQHAAQNERVYRLFNECHRQLWCNNDFDMLASNLHTIICKATHISDCKLIKYDAKYDDLIAHRLTSSNYYLGRINHQERALLFSDTIQSTALYLIGEVKNPIAILALGSDDINHFSPVQDTLFSLDFVRSLKQRLREFA